MGKYINGCCLCCLRRWVENGMKAKFNSEEKLELITIKKTCQERTHLVTSAFFFFVFKTKLPSTGGVQLLELK